MVRTFAAGCIAIKSWPDLDATIDLKDETGTTIPSQIKIQLSLVSDPENDNFNTCDGLKQKFGARLAMNTNRQGTRIEGDAKEIKGDVKEIKRNIDRNSKCRIHDDVHSLRINHDAFRCQGWEHFKDNQGRPAG